MSQLHWTVLEAADFAHRQRPSAAISRVTLHIADVAVYSFRDEKIWPDATAPSLDVYVPATVLDLGYREVGRIVHDAVWLALANVLDRERFCPCCRKPYEVAS